MVCCTMQFLKTFIGKSIRWKKYVVKSSGKFKSVPKGNIIKEYTDKIVCAPNTYVLESIGQYNFAKSHKK